MASHVCEYCEKPYVRWRWDQRFCCSPCHVAWWQEERREGVRLLRSLRAKVAASDDERGLVS
jgi:hypothetical protein